MTRSSPETTALDDLPTERGGGGAARHESLIAPLGILGGGQLGRMTLQAASVLGIDVVIGEHLPGTPAGRLAQREVIFNGGWDDPVAIAELARLTPVITLESEFVDAAVLEQLEAQGATVLPTPQSVRIVQDKLLQKQALAQAGLPVAAFERVDALADAEAAAARHGWPVVLKARRNGYDGYGNALVRDAASLAAACAALGWPERELLVEQFVPFERELAVIVVRERGGGTIAYPVVETQQDPERHICRTVLAPAPVEREVAERAAAVAAEAVRAVGGVGTFGVELFALPDGSVLVNELAPRPHNSGHYTIEGCVTSQFANHVRAVLGLPLGDPSLRAPAVVMVNLLGTAGSLPGLEEIAEALRVPGVALHLYGKSENRVGRKMGHVTAYGATLDDALHRANLAARGVFR
jgi:5-(carboxyamino)imidazole ribonucleotide synthase